MVLLRATGNGDWAAFISRGACKVEGCCQPPVIEVSVVTFRHRVAVCASCRPTHLLEARLLMGSLHMSTRSFEEARRRFDAVVPEVSPAHHLIRLQ